jgi:energy-coupling factor transport system ATP-binding protein
LTGNTVLESLTATALALGEDPKLTQQGGQEWLRRMGLEGMRNRNPHELSGGETRRLALASAFMHKPGLVYLDEPTVGLDTFSWKNVVDAIVEAKHSGARIYLATHDAQLLKLADEVITLEPKSAPIAQATKPQLFSPLAMFAASALTLAGALAFRSVSAAALALFAEAILMALAMWLVPSLRRFGLLWPMAFGVASVGFSNWWLSDAHSVEAAALVAIRVAFFGLPGLLLAAAASPSELGDQLGQKLRIPARPVVAAMVGLNRVHRLRGNWASLAFVRKVRLVAKKGLAEYWSLILFSLIEATRSAESTAIAMESRGFSAKDATGKPVPRTWAIEATWGKLDLLLLAAAAGCVALGLFGL